MSKREIVDGYANFSELLGREELERALEYFKDAPEYKAVLRYHEASLRSAALELQVQPVSLLKDALDSFKRKKMNPELVGISQKVDGYRQRLLATVEVLSAVAPEVPKKMHFVWVGGSEVGAIQRDYINIWKEVLAREGHAFNLWYDSDALLAFETNRVIVESARTHAMESGGAATTSPSELARLIEDRALVLKQQMFAHLKQAHWMGKADEARIDLLVRAYGKDEATLTTFRQKCLDSHLAMASKELRLRDVREEFAEHFLRDIYEREVAFRGNFAAASDVVRLQVEDLEGGTYSDVDYLPPLAEKLGGVDISGLNNDARLGVLQILLDSNKSLMPGRNEKRYGDSRAAIPAEIKDALVKFAQSHPGPLDIFVPPEDRHVPMDAIRLTSNEMNSHMMAHPGAGMTQTIMSSIRFYNDCLFDVESRAVVSGIKWTDFTALTDIAVAVFDEKFNALSFRSLFRKEQFRSKVIGAIVKYHSDGIRYDARATIDLTGPGAVVSGIVEFIEMNLVPGSSWDVRERLKLSGGYNAITEEELIHSWTENVDTPEQWLKKEQDSWGAGKYKARYAGNLQELLKGQTLNFEKGWPVIEGRPVLLTDLLQRLVDELGEPFIRAMNDKLSGDVTFDKLLSIGFDERQQILAQSVSELPVSVGSQPIGNLNEMFARIDHGSLSLEQLSPLQRVLLGGLFGAQTLDNEGFGSVWQATQALAGNTSDRGLAARYEAIEQALLKQKTLTFQTGFKARRAVQGSTQSAQELKVRALAEPLSVRQWGEHIARIQTVAQDEYRSRILQRGVTVLELFFQSGATSAKQLPQDLLIRGEGDPGRRCYPLALVMAAALDKGETAERALIGKLANASLAPEESETHAMLQVLDELRAFPMMDFGHKAGTVSLEQIVQRLEAKDSTGTLMLNTDSHSLLLAKVVTDGKSAYRFYDPNFGLFGFEHVQALQQGLKRFFNQRELAALYGLDGSASARFNLIELDGARIAEKPLPSNIRVAGLLLNEPVSGGRTIAPWQHHAALRVRALSENARLGRCLAELDGRGWAQQIDQVTTQLRESHQLARDYVPLFETVQATSAGKWSVSLINIKDPQKVVSVTVDDARLFRIKTWLQERFEDLGGVNAERDNEISPSEPSAVHTLNAGFSIQALIEALREREGNAQNSGDAPLAMAVRLHGYVIYAQLVHGNLVDIAGVIQLVRHALMDERVIAATTSSVAGRWLGRIAGEGVAGVLGFVNVGFDIYELANADNPVSKARSGTQLFFDSAGLVLSGTGLVVGGTAGAFAGALAVPLAGLGFGVSALASNYSLILEKAQQVGLYFARLKLCYGLGGHFLDDGIVRPMPEVVIKNLDLRGRIIEFDSQELFPEHRNGPGLPDYYGDTSRAINIREGWGLPDYALIAGGIGNESDDDYRGDRTVNGAILPCTPKCYFGYEYQVFPGAVNRHDKGFDEARELEFDSQGNRQFYFTPWTPFEHIVYKLVPVYELTNVRVLLDNDIRSLYVPRIPLEWRGRISYEIEGAGGQCSLSLNPGVVAVHLTAASGTAPVRWVLRAPWVGERAVTIDSQRLKVDGIEIHVGTGSEVHIQLENGQVFLVDWTQKRLILEEQEIDDALDSRQLQDHLAKLAHEHRLASPYVPLHNFSVPFADPAAPIRTNGFYDVARKRIVYARDLPASFTADIQLGAVVGDQLYFYHREQPTIWRVDSLTGLVNGRYRLLNPEQGSTVIACQDAGAAVRVVQQVTDREGISYRMDYLLYPDKVNLSAIATTLDEEQAFDPDDFAWDSWNAFLARFTLRDSFADASPAMAEGIELWKPAVFISMQVHVKDQTHTAWLRVSDNWVVWSNEVRASGLVLLMPSSTDGNSILLYDDAHHTLWRWVRSTRNDGVLETVLSGLKSMVAVAGGYVTVTEEGLLFDVGNDGSVQLHGLNEQWLSAHPAWLTELSAIAREHPVSGFAIIGLSNANGAPLSAWHQDNKLLLVDNGDKDIRFLGLTPDRNTAWLFAPSTGQVYRHAFLKSEELATAFGDGTQLLQHHLTPGLQKAWPEWSFAEVVAHGAGLRGQTSDGIEVDLNVDEPARIAGVTGKWIREKTGGFYPYDKKALQALGDLVSGHLHGPRLPLKGYWGYHWYVSDINRVLGETNTQLETRLLGSVNQKTALLYEVPSRLVYSSSREIWLQNSGAWRDAEVLTLDAQGNVDDLARLIPDDVTRMILGYGQDATRYRISAAAWQRLECIVVDCHRSLAGETLTPGTLILDMAPHDGLLLSLADGHLVWTDPDNGHSLVLRDVYPETSQNRLNLSFHVQGTYLGFGLDNLIETLVQEKGSQGSARLEELIPKLKVVITMG